MNREVGRGAGDQVGKLGAVERVCGSTFGSRDVGEEEVPDVRGEQRRHLHRGEVAAALELRRRYDRLTSPNQFAELAAALGWAAASSVWGRRQWRRRPSAIL
jgi:hypothetical protein